MFRVSLHAYKARCLLQRSMPTTAPLASFSRTPLVLAKYKRIGEPDRDVCPQPPKVVPPPKDDRMLWGTIAALVLAGSFAVYAKKSPEVRDWLTMYAPWFDDVIAIAYQENYTYWEYAQICARDARKYIEWYMDRPKECWPEEPPVKPCSVKAIEVPPPVETKEDDEDKPPCAALTPPVITMDVCEIEACMKDLGDTAINNYMTARDACIVYNKSVRDAMKKFCYFGMRNLHKEREERLALVKQSIEDGAHAHSQLIDLNRYLECGGVQGTETKIEATKKLLQDYYTNILIIKTEYIWENDKSLALDVQLKKVSDLIEKYIKENRNFYPTLNYKHQKPHLGGEEIDFLVIHSRKYVKNLQADVNDAIIPLTDRIDRALASLPQGDKAKKDRDALIQNTFKKRQADMIVDYANRCNELKAENDKALKEAMAIQAKKHEENMVIKLELKEAEVLAKFNKLVAEKVAHEKHLMKVQLAEMASKLSIVEGKLNERLKVERETRRSQELWTAGASLLAATKRGDPCVRVEKELRAIEKASGDGDKLVLSVLHAIPSTVWDAGVVPESVLRDKYLTMEKVALQVALVEEEGGPLPLYFLSWLQSALLFMKLSTIPQVELDNPPKEPFKDLDTFDLLQRARYWVERGNIAAALRYVNSLEGASRVAASTWHDAARSHVETRQAAEAILAHAAALGLKYI